MCVCVTCDGVCVCVCYRYLKWKLGSDIGLVARCEYDALMQTATGHSFINIKALNEWDSKVRGQ